MGFAAAGSSPHPVADVPEVGESDLPTCSLRSKTVAFSISLARSASPTRGARSRAGPGGCSPRPGHCAPPPAALPVLGPEKTHSRPRASQLEAARSGQGRCGPPPLLQGTRQSSGWALQNDGARIQELDPTLWARARPPDANRDQPPMHRGDLSKETPPTHRHSEARFSPLPPPLPGGSAWTPPGDQKHL